MSLGFLPTFGGSRGRGAADSTPIEHVQLQRPLRRVMAFTGHSIDEIVNCPIAKRKVLGYYKLHRWVERESEVSDLERQWNPLA